MHANIGIVVKNILDTVTILLHLCLSQFLIYSCVLLILCHIIINVFGSLFC